MNHLLSNIIRYYDQFKPEFYAKLQANHVAAQMAGNIQASVYFYGSIHEMGGDGTFHSSTFGHISFAPPLRCS